MRYATLVNGVIKGATPVEWAVWFNDNDKHIELLEVSGLTISTVFLGVNHGSGSNDLWFETWVHGNNALEIYGEEDIMLRYETLEEAKAGHQKLLDKYLASLPISRKPRLDNIDL